MNIIRFRQQTAKLCFMFLLFCLIIIVGIPTSTVAADPGLPLPRMPICGDQDGSELPFVLNCTSFVPSFDVQTYQFPWVGSSFVLFDFVFREASYNNELGYFKVDNATGDIGGLKPGDPGYLIAAFQQADVIFPSGSTAYTPDVQLPFYGNDILVFFIIQNNTLENFLNNNPNNNLNLRPLAFFSLDTLNPDGIDHFVGFQSTAGGFTQFGFEDLTGGGDVDYDDIVYDVSPPLQSNDEVFLDLPLEYTDFNIAVQGSNGGGGPGYVNSWFDHESPNYSTDGYLWLWNGDRLPDPVDVKCKFGRNCYDGHDGIDFRHASDTVLAAAPGTVFGKVLSSTGFGRYLFIDHDNCFATLYGHLETILVNNDDSVADRQPLGMMGSTGKSTGTHLHFGVYYDPNCDGNWTDKVVADPYGWRPESPDPWDKAPNKNPLWKYPISGRNLITNSGGSASSPGDIYSVTAPSGAVDDTVTVEMLVAPPVTAPSAQLRSTGYSFWMRVLEWLTESSGSSALTGASNLSFNVPVTVAVNYDPSWMLHIDINQLAIQQWDETNQVWIALLTNVDTQSNQASAQTNYPGHFDLQAPLVCPADTLEPNDNYDGASVVQTDGMLVNNLFDIVQDEDWFKFDAVGGVEFNIQTTNLAAGVDTAVEIYDTDGVTLLESDDNGGGGKASRLVWQAPQSGTYFLRVNQAAGSAYGCSATYQISANQVYLIFLPTILR